MRAHILKTNGRGADSTLSMKMCDAEPVVPELPDEDRGLVAAGSSS
jgi:hypothetical protein